MDYLVINVTFDSRWVLSRREDDKLPVDRFIEEMRVFCDFKLEFSSLTECSLKALDPVHTEETLRKTVRTALRSCYGMDFDMRNVTIEVKNRTDSEESTESDNMEEETNAFLMDVLKKKIQQTQMIEEEPAENQKGGAEEDLRTIENLIGAPEFKKLAQECVKIAPGIKKYKTQEAFLHQAYLFSVNDGNGLTTYLKMFGNLITHLGLFEGGDEVSVIEADLPAENEIRPGETLYDSVSTFMSDRVLKGPARIVSIDISEWMTKTGDILFRRFLTSLSDDMGRNIVVFRVPFVEKDILQDIKRNIGDILFVRDISIVPLDIKELDAYARQALIPWGFTMEEDAWEIFDARITEEKSDGRFYGINTVEKVIREMIYYKQLHNACHGIDDTVIKREEITQLSADYNGNSKKGMEMLDEMVGMKELKERIISIVSQIEAVCKSDTLKRPCIHMRFVGNPGTGKTTVARVIGQILKEKGILRNGNFFEYAGKDFCGRYVGETAPKTAAMCRDAYGSVMFIDEAYTLYRNDSIGAIDYGREAIDTLIAEMENHRSDLVVIMAGYPDEMETLMKGNAGLASRMPYVIEFPNYSRQELYEIFIKMAEKTFTFGLGFKDAVKEYFDSLTDEMIGSKEFSNARFVRNLYERTWGKAVLRTQLDKSDEKTLIKEDFLLASSEKEFKRTVAKRTRPLGFL